tara:strand:- start:15550 stop:16206 length:657 start_codon:yes stop_codon:yes gene_type:complete
MPGTKSIDQRVDDWWDKHYGDVYLDDGTAPQDQEVMLEEEPPPVFITFGEGSDTLQQLAPQFDDPEVTRRSHNAYQGALRAWANYGDSFSQFGDEYDVDPYILASIAGLESGGKPDAIGPTKDVGLMQMTERTWGRIMPGRSLEDRLDPRLSIEAAAKLFNQDRDILKNEDLAVLAYNVGHNGVKAIIQGEKDFPGKSQYYWPVITLTHERLTQELRE